MRNDIDKMDWYGDRQPRQWSVDIGDGRSWKIRGESLKSALYSHEVGYCGACIVYMSIEREWEAMSEEERKEFGDDYCQFHFDVSCTDADRAGGDVGRLLEAARIDASQLSLDKFRCPMCGDDSGHAVACGACGDFMCGECFISAVRGRGEWPCCHEEMSALDLLSVSTE